MTHEISVVVPCRNERATLETCLGALEAQDYDRERFEVIVVDGGSTDGCRSFVHGRGFRLLSDHGTGPAGARNVGIAAARAPIVAFTDADCIPREDWLSRIMEVFQDDPALAGVGGALRMSRRSLIGIMEDIDAQCFYVGFITSNVAYRRAALLEVGGFCEELVCAEDYDLAWRLMDAGHRVAFDPRPVVTHDPPEVSGPAWAYFRKQAWYARNDIPAHLRAIRRARAQPGAPGAAHAIRGALDALPPAAMAAATGAGAMLASPAALGLGVAGAALLSSLRVWRAVRHAREDPSHVPAMVGLNAVKTLARGAGTLAGLSSLLRPATWRASALARDDGLRRTGGVAFAPAERAMRAQLPS